MTSTLKLSIIIGACTCFVASALVAQDVAPANTKQDPAKQAAKQVDDDQDKQTDPTAMHARPDKSDAKDRDPGAKSKGAMKARDEVQIARRIRRDEAKHRKRLGLIKRMRELAQKQRNAERLRALTVLERKMTTLHERKIRRARAQLSAGLLQRANEDIQRGRKRTAKASPNADAAKGAGAVTGKRRAGQKRETSNRPKAASGGKTDQNKPDREKREKKPLKKEEDPGNSGGNNQ